MKRLMQTWDKRLYSFCTRYDSRSLILRHYRRKYRCLIEADDVRSLLDKEWNPKSYPEFDNKIPVFVLWYQGFENAPEIVRVSRRQLGRLLTPDRYKIIELDQNNIKKYIGLPSYIEDKIGSGIHLTQLSDIIRAALLYKWGGYWIDSTYFLTDALPDFTREKGIFAFRYIDERADGEKCSNAFFYADKGEEIFGRTLLMFQKYWENHTFLIFYTLFHLFFALSVDANESSHERFYSTCLREASNNGVMAENFAKPYNDSDWNYWTNLTFAHKLTYKVNAQEYDKNSVYFYIVNNY